MTALFALLLHEHPAAIVARDRGRAITTAEFLGDVAALAPQLPARPHVINLCTNRYRFSVGLAAALSRKLVTLLPPNDKAFVLAELAADFPDLFCLYDNVPPEAAIESFAFPSDLPGSSAHTVPAFSASQAAIVLFTSGSTGRPMPHVKSWGTLVISARAAGRRLLAASLRGGTVFGTVPHQHSYGLELTVLLALQNHLAFDADRLFYPSDITAALAAAPRPRILVSTPIHLRTLLADSDNLARTDLVLSATAPLSAQLAAAVEASFRAPLIEIYGCSEAGQVATRRTVETKVWRCLDGISLVQDERGTWARSDAATGPVEAPTLLGDEITLCARDTFLLRGRLADLISVAGKRTSLAYLNHQLTAIEGVRDGVFLMPEEDAEKTMRLVAFAVAPDLSRDVILAALSRRIDAAFMPRPLFLVDALPRSPLGKLPRAALRRLAMEMGAVTDSRREVELQIPVDHPTCAGHFPGNPIIPGAVLLDEVLRAVAKRCKHAAGPCAIRQVKFLRPVRPGDRLLIRWTAVREEKIQFECWLYGTEQPALTGTLRIGRPRQ